MLAVSRYELAYIQNCHAQITAQLDAYAALAMPAGPTRAAFDRLFFRNLVLALDHMFVHRTRGAEGKDGNPLNEVRLLCAAVGADGKFAENPTIKYVPERSVLKLRPGDEVVLDARGFAQLADGFFAELARRFS